MSDKEREERIALRISNLGLSLAKYTVKAILHFNDGINSGSLVVSADSENEASSVATNKLKDTWKGVQKIEIISVKKN